LWEKFSVFLNDSNPTKEHFSNITKSPEKVWNYPKNAIGISINILVLNVIAQPKLDKNKFSFFFVYDSENIIFLPTRKCEEKTLFRKNKFILLLSVIRNLPNIVLLLFLME